MKIAYIRCACCGKQYQYQFSGASSLEQKDRTQDFCPDCYAQMKDEVDALEKKLTELRENGTMYRYQHKYIETNEVSFEDIKKSTDSYKTETSDGWGMLKCWFRWNEYYIEPGLNRVFKKVLVDTKTGKVVSECCPNTYRFKDSVTKCCGREYIQPSKDEIPVAVRAYPQSILSDEVVERKL